MVVVSVGCKSTIFTLNLRFKICRNTALSNTKFKYNPETLSYEEVELTWKDKLRRVSYHTISAVVFALVVLVAAYPFILSKGVKKAEKENELTRDELAKFSEVVDQSLVVLDEIQERDDKIYRSIFETDPYPKSKRELGTGGNPHKYDKYKTMDYGDVLEDIAKKIELLQKKIVAQSRSFDEVIKLVKKKEKMLQAIPSIQPISNKDLTRLASGFGMRMHPIYKILKMHAGMDFTADIGTEIFATGDGVVEKAGQMSGYGQIVIIDHGFGYKTRYAHVSAFNVKEGQKVKRGDVIAYVGNTGASVGPHLHYEVRKNGEAVNPVNYFFNDLSPEEYEEIVKISERPTQSM